ncbi:MAG: TonB family protein [Acetobacter aceti]|uniref:TonB C-terminal domain-containing protein n=1 Tax=Acetobacter aceti TaxID=435 RepID=A0A1U9KFG0_ACEAC|nr:energy transducer TonB [Acetobacter aceti]AQS84540.1 hypothetical protein A0U92_06830 [Acetobacter aceti]
MTASPRPSATPGTKKEPLLVGTGKQRGTSTTKRPAVDDEAAATGRIGLRPAFIAKTGAYRNLKSVRTPLAPRQVFADPGLLFILVFSVLLHALLLAFAIYMSLHHSPRGNPQASETGAVDMMFVTPPAESGMKGEHSDQQAGGSSATKSSQSSDAQPEQAEAAEGTDHPTPETPAAPPIPEAPSDENYPRPTNAAAPINPASNKAGKASRQTTKQSPPRKQTARQTPTHQRAPSPFDSLTDLSLDQSSAPPRPRHHGRTGGSGGPIDLSLGPLVQNGNLNTPFATRSTVRGVSDDYSEEVDRWIRRHMYYPEEAAQNGEEGPSSVHVVLDRSGRVRFVRLTNQSGSYLLDAATTGMFRSAQLPPIPPGITGDHFDLDVTVNYILIRH